MILQEKGCSEKELPVKASKEIKSKELLANEIASNPSVAVIYYFHYDT